MRRIVSAVSVCILAALAGCQSKPAATPATTEAPSRRPSRSSAGRWSLLSEKSPISLTPVEQARRVSA